MEPIAFPTYDIMALTGYLVFAMGVIFLMAVIIRHK